MKKLLQRDRMRAERLRAQLERRQGKLRIRREEIRSRRRKRNVDSMHYAEGIAISSPLDFLAHDLGLVRRRANSAYAQMYFPPEFSLFENPDQVLSAIYRYVEYLKNSELQGIHFDQSACRHMDHGALALLNVLVTEGDRQRPMALSGVFPGDERLRRVVAASGLPKVLRVTGNQFPDIECFDLETGGVRQSRAHRSTAKELAASRFVEYIDRCLARQGASLSDLQANSLLNIIGEVLGNVEEHSGRGRWWFSGHFEEHTFSRGGVGQVVLLDFGSTIDETIRSLPAHLAVAKQVNDRIREYRRLDSTRSEADYRTFLALQQGVSSLKHVDPDRGQGTIRLLQFFAQLSTAGSEPEMLILSGSSRIHVDQSQASRALSPGTSGRFELPLNASGDLRLPPDRRLVHTMKGRLPGTLVAFRFSL